MQTAWKTMGPMGIALCATNLWVFWIGWPALVGRDFSLGDAVVSAVAVVLTAIGVRYLRRSPRQPDKWESIDKVRPPDLWREQVGIGALLVGVPGVLAIGPASRAEALNQHALDGFVIVPAALALSLYGAAVLSYGRPVWLQNAGSSRALAGRPWQSTPGRYGRARRLAIIGALCGGAVAVGLIAPILAGFGELRSAWGDAAREGGLLTAVLAGGLAVSLVGNSLAETLRGRGPAKVHSGQRAMRTAGFLLLAMVGALTYWVAKP